MPDCFVVMEYDGHQRDSYVIAAFTSEADANAYREWCKASTADPEYDFVVQSIVLDGAPGDLPGGYAVTIDGRGKIFNPPYWSTSVNHSGPAETDDRYADGPGKPPTKCFSGYGVTPEAALSAAEALRQQFWPPTESRVDGGTAP